MLQRELAGFLAAEGLTPKRDEMPLGEGVKQELPGQKYR